MLIAQIETESGHEIDAELADGIVEIYQDNHWAGRGRFMNGRIVDCDAHLGADEDESESAYTDLESELTYRLELESKS